MVDQVAGFRAGLGIGKQLGGIGAKIHAPFLENSSEGIATFVKGQSVR